MKTIGLEEFKDQLSTVLEKVKEGESIEITFGENNESRAVLVPSEKKTKKPVRLGLLEGKVRFRFADDFKMTEEEFLGL